MRSIAFLLALFLPTAASAQTVWKFKAGDTFAYERIAKSDEEMIVAKQQSLKQTVRSEAVYRFEVASVANDAATLKVVIEKFQVQHPTGPGPGPGSLDNKLLERLKGAELMLVVSRSGEVKKVEGYDKLIELMGEKRAGVDKALRLVFSEDLVRSEFAEIFHVVPVETPAAGGQWRREGAMPLPPFGKLATTLGVYARGPDRAGHAVFTGTMTGKFERSTEPNELFRVTAAQFSLDKTQWTVSFDPSEGRLVRGSFTYEIHGDLTLELVGAASPVVATIRREVTTRLLPRD